MAITYKLENDLRYRQGMEKGYEKAALERNTDFVKWLIRHTDYDDRKIAAALNVSLAFVDKIRKSVLE